MHCVRPFYFQTEPSASGDKGGEFMDSARRPSPRQEASTPGKRPIKMGRDPAPWRERSMIAAPIPVDDAKRPEALKAMNLLDSPPEERFERNTRVLTLILRVPMAYI